MEMKVKLKDNYYLSYTVGSEHVFVDHEGVEGPWTDRGVYHQPTIDAFGLTTTEKAITWLYHNMQRLGIDPEEFSGRGYKNSVLTLTGGNYSCTSSGLNCILSNLGDWGISISYGVWTNISRALVFRNSNCLNDFLLVDQDDQEEGVKKIIIKDVEFNSEYVWRIQRAIDEKASGNRESTGQWDRLREYSYTMDPSEYNWFRGIKGSTLFFGLELEISTALSCAEIQHIVTEIEPKQEPFFIFKKDSTITGKYDHMVELVTVPCTPRYLRTEWKIFFDKIKHLSGQKNKKVSDYFDIRSDLSNGLHIHISRDSFEDKQHMKKFCNVFNLQDRFTSKLLGDVSGRQDYKTNRWCKPNSNFSGRTLAYNLKNATSNASEKYITLNTNNTHTLEVRLYQGIFDLGHILRCIDFTEAAFDICAELPLSVINWRFASTLKTFVLKSCKYKTYKKEIK